MQLPIPTAIKIAEGNPGKQKLPENEPQPAELSTINPPDFLTGEAKALWIQIAPEYQAMGLLKAPDSFKFGHYLFAIIMSNKLAKEIEEEGGYLVGMNNKGHPSSYHHPRHQQYLNFVKQANMLGIQFGDSPAARARLGNLLDDAPDELDNLIGNKPE